MEKYKNLKEIIELLEEELDENNENVSATLDLEDLLELREVLKDIENEYISVQKINEKIEELKSAQESTDKCDWQWIYKCQIDILEELLKGGEE